MKNLNDENYKRFLKSDWDIASPIPLGLGVGKNPPNPKTHPTPSGLCAYFRKFRLEIPKSVQGGAGFGFINFFYTGTQLDLLLPELIT